MRQAKAKNKYRCNGPGCRKVIQRGEIYKFWAKGKIGKKYCLVCAGKSSRRRRNKNWKGIYLIGGYPSLYLPKHHRASSSGNVYEHVVVIEKKLRRPLLSGEVTHHIDGNKLNNSPDNLEVFPSNKAHLNFHRTKTLPSF